MPVKSIEKVKDLKGKKVLLRCDFNEPVKNGRVQDEYKILKQIKTIEFLKEKGAKIAILTHFGRPEAGKYDSKYSTLSLARALSRLLGQPVSHAEDVVGFDAGTKLSKLGNGGIMMLENIRFEKGEEENSTVLAKKLAKPYDLYVSDAFGVSHRRHASLVAIKKFLPHYAGFLIAEEVAMLNKALKPKKPLVVVMGGAKLETKVKLLKTLKNRADFVLLGGALANNFLAAAGYEVGKSLTDPAGIALARKIRDDKIILPVDLVVCDRPGRWQARLAKPGKVKKGEYIFDIGPETIKLYARYIKKAATIFWNGPLGLFEDDQYRHGTVALASVIAARSRGPALGIVGGGETIEALKMTKMEEQVDWISTGGGAMLDYLSGEEMPGLEGII